MNYKEVFTIVESGQGDQSKKRWLRIGTAFTNSDGSMNVILDAFPANGKLNIRDPKPRDDAGGAGSGSGAGARGQRGGGF